MANLMEETKNMKSKAEEKNWDEKAKSLLQKKFGSSSHSTRSQSRKQSGGRPQNQQ